MNMLYNKKVVFIGGSSGIGLESAKQAIAHGAEVVIASRSENKLQHAKEQLGMKVSVQQLDLTIEHEVEQFFQNVGSFDHLVVSAAETSGGPFLKTDTSQARQLFENKFWGQYYAVKYGAPKLSPNGSIVLFSGVVAYKSMIGSSILGAANAAVSNMGKTLALELAPIRVNVVSPGIMDTPARSKMTEEARQQLYESIASRLPVQRVGTPEDAAQSVMYLLTNSFVTGTVIHVDGGHVLT